MMEERTAEEIKREIMDEYHNHKNRYDEYPDAFILKDDDWDLMREEANKVMAEYAAVNPDMDDVKEAKEDSLLKFNGIKICTFSTARQRLDWEEDVTAFLDPETRMDWLMWVTAEIMEDDRPPFSGNFLRSQHVTSDEIFTLSARCATVIKSFTISNWEERKKVLVRGILSDLDNAAIAHTLMHMDMDRILKKLEEL